MPRKLRGTSGVQVLKKVMDPTKFVDIKNYDFKRGDMLIIQDLENSKYIHNFIVRSVTGNHPGPKKLECELVQSNNPTLRPLTKFTYDLNPTDSPVMGHVIPQNNLTMGTMRDHSIDPVQAISHYIVMFLRTRAGQKYSATYTEIIDNLKNFGFFTDEEDAAIIKIVRGVIKAKPGILGVGGRFVKLLSFADDKGGTMSNSTIRKIDKQMLLEGICKIIESGLFGPIIWEHEK